MNAVELLLNLDLAVLVVLGVILVLAINFEEFALPISGETVALYLCWAAFLALILVSLLKFVRMEG